MGNANITENIFNRARKIIQMDAKGELNQKAKDALKENKRKISNDDDDDDDFITESPIHKNDNANANVNDLDNYKINENTLSNCKGLPIEIMESFKEKRIDTRALATGTGSVLDDLERLTGKPLVEQRVIKEEPISKTTMPQVSNNIQTNVDYSIIKMIVEDCMKKSLLSIKKTLNENKIIENNNIQALKIGDKFSFITENGDLYEAKLEFKKNLKKK